MPRKRRDYIAVVMVAALAAPLTGAPAPVWTSQPSGVTARLRGVSAASERVVWASGANGTVIRTEDGGKTWRKLVVPDAEALDFRDVDAIDERTACVLSIGPGEASRIFKTTDAGATWTLQFRNEDSKAFFDAMAFRDGGRGFAFSDSVDGAFVILRTDDGAKWSRVPAPGLPAALSGEGAYAASGSNLAVRGDFVWIGTTASRILRSSDAGRSWTAVQTPLPTGPSAGIFSVAFRDALHGVVVGGDYKQETSALDNAAVTSDGGRTWRVVNALSGFRSAVAYVPGLDRTAVAIGPTGADVSTDDGVTWTAIPGPGFHAISFAPKSRTGWGVGEKGSIARIEM